MPTLPTHRLRGLDEIGKATGGDTSARPNNFCGLELGRDELATAIVAERSSKVQGRDTERGAELDNLGLCLKFEILSREPPQLSTAFWVDPKEKLITVLMMQAAPLQARYYRSLIRNLTSQALIE